MPCWQWSRSAVRMASPASSYEALAPPWLWMSSSPGVENLPRAVENIPSFSTRSRQPLPVP